MAKVVGLFFATVDGGDPKFQKEWDDVVESTVGVEGNRDTQVGDQLEGSSVKSVIISGEIIVPVL